MINYERFIFICNYFFLLLILTGVENINDNLIKQNELIEQQNILLENSKSPNTLDTLYYLNPEQ